MKKTLSLFIIVCFLLRPAWPQSQETPQFHVAGEPAPTVIEAEVQEIKMKQYALTQDFRLVVQKPLIIVLQTDFLPGEATIHPEMITELNKVAEFLDWRIDSDVEVIAHTDNVPPIFANNLELSKARANSTKTYLVQVGGISSDRIITHGRGDTEPRADNSTEEGKALNRRIEFRFIPTTEEVAELQELRFSTVISYSDSIPINQVRLNSTLPSGWAYLENSGALGNSSINPVTVKYNNIIWDLGELGNQTGVDLEFSIVPLDYTQIASISTLKSYLEFTHPDGISTVTDVVGTSISTRVEESLFRIIISGATFDVNRWELKPAAAGLLTPLGDFLNWQTDIDITIGGFSDNRGKADWNLQLSENRAGSARDHLAQVYGISPDRMDVVGFGPQFPRAPNNTANDRALNRRVEFTVKSDFQQTVSTDMVVLEDSLVHEMSIPTLAISSMASSPTNTSPIPVIVTFSESVTGFVKGNITIGNGSVSNFTGSGTTYAFDITPYVAGNVTVDIAAKVAQNAAGNSNMAATQFTITYEPPIIAEIVPITTAGLQVGKVYLFGGAAFVLVGAGFIIAAAKEGPEEKPAGIGLPPEWP